MKNKKSYKSRATRKHIIDRFIENGVTRAVISGETKMLTQLKLYVLVDEYKKVFHCDPFQYMVNTKAIDLKFNLLNEIYEDYEKAKKLEDDKKVYVIGCLDKGYCKIGISTYPEQRLKEIQTGCPFKVEVLKVFKGDRNTEKELHKKYKQYHSYGEWFFIKGELKKAIDNF